MLKLRKYFSTKQTPQSEKLPGSTQIKNSAGGYVWEVNDWTRLDRFLILGSESGTYYAKPQALTVENAEAVLRCLQADGIRTVARIVEISTTGRAPKNDPALFALAMAAGLGNDETRKAALDALPQVARIGTHLFHFLDYVEGFRGWGRGLRRAVGSWYTQKTPAALAYQAIKYQQRDGWSHRDALRLAHPKALLEEQALIYKWITKGATDFPEGTLADNGLRMIWAFEQAKQATTVREVCTLIEDYRLPWEAVPTQWLADPKVWDTLLPILPMTALIRNLGRLTKLGVLSPMSANGKLVAARLTNEAALKKARIHPLKVLSALTTYQQGHGVRGSLTWQPVQRVTDALDTAFYKSFRNIVPTGKRIVLALDVSGSMSFRDIAGMPGVTPRVGSAAMALVTAATENNVEIMAFSRDFVPLKISPRRRLDDAVKAVSGLPFSATDCALPMKWALKNKVEADAFVVYTDSETWAGITHPSQALVPYRQKMGIAAKLVVVGMVSNGFSIADPKDAGMLDVVGFDTATPALMSDFIRD